MDSRLASDPSISIADSAKMDEAHAAVSKLAKEALSKGAARKGLWVRVPPAASPRDNPPPVDAAGRMEVIRELCSFEGRLTGTDAERRAAKWLASRLRAIGRRVETEPTYVHPQVGLVHGAHCALGF